MAEKYIVSLIFFIYGVLIALKPELIIKFHVWTTKKIWGAEFKATQKTNQRYKVKGIIFAVFAILILFL